MKSIKCPFCGLMAFASLPDCKRCGRPLDATISPQVHSEQPGLRGVRQGGNSDSSLVESIKAKQTVIYAVGFLGALAFGIAAAVNTEDTTRMAVLFVGIVLVGFLSTWVVASLVESRMVAGSGEAVHAVTSAQRASVLTSSLVCASIVFSSEYGFIISPLIIVFFNGAMYLYGRQLESKRGGPASV